MSETNIMNKLKVPFSIYCKLDSETKTDLYAEIVCVGRGKLGL